MGCSGSKSGDGGVAAAQKKPKTKAKAFQGTGNRLGSANDPAPRSTAAAAASSAKPDLPARKIDPKLTDVERERQRDARLAAAEQRQKASGVPKGKKKKASQKGEPLRGPNTEPLLRWNA